MPETNRLQNATRNLEQICAWSIEQDTKEEKLKLLIQEKNRKEHDSRHQDSVE